MSFKTIESVNQMLVHCEHTQKASALMLCGSSESFTSAVAAVKAKQVKIPRLFITQTASDTFTCDVPNAFGGFSNLTIRDVSYKPSEVNPVERAVLIEEDSKAQND